MPLSFLKQFFTFATFLFLISKSQASFSCRDGLSHFKGVALSIAAGKVSGIAQNVKYARSTLQLSGENEFSLRVGNVQVGEGAFGVVFPLNIEGSVEAAQSVLGFDSGDELVVKFPHNTALEAVNKITAASLVSEVETENKVFDFCEKYGMEPHPALQRTILYASLEGKTPFLVKKRAKGASLVKYGGAKKLSPEQHMRLENLFYFVLFIEKESERLLGERMAIDIKPDNLYWNGEDWRFYEISRTPQDNTFFTAGAFSGYLAIIDGYTGN